MGPEPHKPCTYSLLLHYLAGNFKGLCKQIDHFPEDADYEADTAEYFLRESHRVLTSLAEGSLQAFALRFQNQAYSEPPVRAEGRKLLSPQILKPHLLQETSPSLSC